MVWYGTATTLATALMAFIDSRLQHRVKTQGGLVCVWAGAKAFFGRGRQGRAQSAMAHETLYAGANGSEGSPVDDDAQRA